VLSSADPLLIVALGAVVFAVMVSVGAVRPLALAPLLVVGGAVFIQPNLFGFRASVLGVAVIAFGALIAVFQDRSKPAGPSPVLRALRSPILWVSVSYVWLLFRVAFIDGTLEVASIITGAGLSLVAMVSVLVVVRDAARARELARLFVGLLVALCVSYVVTVLLWTVTGAGSLQIGQIPVGDFDLQPLYFPLTTSASDLQLAGVTVPRFTGLGREPGWMALYCTVAYFAMPSLFSRPRILRLLVLIGLLGTISTAGFGVFIASFALALFLRRRATTAGTAMLRTGWYLVLAGIALWLVLFAPVLGYAAKGDLNATSLAERSAATGAGISALLTNPFPVGLGADRVAGVNIIATVAAFGIIFAIASLLAVLGPLRTHPHKRALLTLLAPIALTLLIAQPPGDSVWIYCLVILVAAVTFAEPPLPRVPGSLRRPAAAMAQHR
jgi:hypothetical protein